MATERCQGCPCWRMWCTEPASTAFTTVSTTFTTKTNAVLKEKGQLGSPGEGFSPKAVLGHKRATKAGFALAHVIKAELVEKQRVIDRLLDEASARADAIDLCGTEIRQLREEVLQWKNKANDAFSRDQAVRRIHR